MEVRATSRPRFYLSSNATWDANDTPLGSRAVPALAPGAISSATTSLTIPAGTAVGTWYVIAKADADSVLPETNEANNTASDAILIGPDLFVSTVSAPAASGAGLGISVTDTTKNQTGVGPAAPSTTRIYLSANPTWEAGDIALGSRSVPTLAAGTATPARSR